MSSKQAKRYAIVDCETTGGSAARHKLTEIAIRIHDGEKVVGQFDSLINPERAIPPYITAITGIDNDMVKDAPTFSEIADKIDGLTKGCVFVAHNASFDYGFLRKEFRELNKRFNRKKLCTVRLSRKLLPGFYSYSLGNIARQLGKEIDNRHRAGGDVDFTVELFGELLKKDRDNYIGFSLNQRNRESILPPNLPRKQFETLPQKLGIYYFTDQRGKVLYVGKAKKLKDRVASHFSGNTNTQTKSRFIKRIHQLKYELCENEMVALLKEAHAIKKHWPPFNRSMKSINLNFGIYRYEDQNGYGRLAIARAGKKDRPLVSFRYQYQARLFLSELAKEYTLCPKLLSLQEVTGGCDTYFDCKACNLTCEKKELPDEYNKRFDQALEDIAGFDHTYCIVERTNSKDKESVVLIEKGRYMGYGFKPVKQEITNVNQAREFIDYGYDDQDIRGIIEGYLRRKSHKAKVISLA